MMNLPFKQLVLVLAMVLAQVSLSQAQQINPGGDLVLGFNDAAGPTAAQNDYVIDLGLSGATFVSAAKTNGGTYTLSLDKITTTNFSSTFQTAFHADASYLNDVAVGVLGASASGGYPRSLYLSAFTTPHVPSGAAFNNAANQNPALNEYASTTPGGWTAEVATAPGTTTAGTVSAYVANPLGTLSSGVLSFNLYEETATKSGVTVTPGVWTDEGTLTINANNDTVTLVTSVPEPATYGLLAAGGLLIVAVRRQLMGKTV